MLWVADDKRELKMFSSALSGHVGWLGRKQHGGAECEYGCVGSGHETLLKRLCPGVESVAYIETQHWIFLLAAGLVVRPDAFAGFLWRELFMAVPF